MYSSGLSLEELTAGSKLKQYSAVVRQRRMTEMARVRLHRCRRKGQRSRWLQPLPTLWILHGSRSYS